MSKMKEMNSDLYEALCTLKHQCKMITSCDRCPLSLENEDGDVECIFESCRPGNLEIMERYYIGKGAIPYDN